MSAKSNIEWTDATWNPVVGCEKVSQGCKFCYAKTVHDRRYKAFLEGKAVAPQYRVPFETVQLKPERLTLPLSWRAPRRIFVNSVSDLFHDGVPDDFIDRVFAVMAVSRRHTFQILTKRAQRMQAYLSAPGRLDDIYTQWSSVSGTPPEVHSWPLPNVWAGVSVENQVAANERIPVLLETPAAVRWISAEPLLGSVYIPEYLPNPLWNDIPSWQSPTIDWIVTGGESGTLKQPVRPMHPDWARSLRNQCVKASVPFLFKQWGEWAPSRSNLHASNRVCIHESGHEQWIPSIHGYVVMQRVGKKRAGRELDGRTWDEYPAVPA